MKQFYGNSSKYVLDILGSNNFKGLSEYDCIIRRDTYGYNYIDINNTNKLKVIFKYILNFKTILAFIGALIVFISSRSFVLLYFWTIVMMINIIIRTFIVFKRYNSLEDINFINQSKVVVLREGVERIIVAEELVKGDIVILKEGSFVAADLRVISSDSLKVDESNIIGKNNLVSKNHHKIFNTANSLGELTNILYRGTLIKEGTASAIVIATGNETILAKLLRSLTLKDGRNQFIEEVERNSFYIQLIVLLVSLIFYFVVPSSNSLELKLLGQVVFISTIMVLPIIAIIGWIKIKRELQQKEILINDFSALDNGTEIKVLFIDKMNSVSEESITFKKIFTNNLSNSLEKVDYKDLNVRRTIEIGLINCNIYKNVKKDLNDHFANSYIDFAKIKNINLAEVERNNIFKFRIFKEGTKDIVTTLVKTKKGFRANSRGRLDDILSRSSFILINGVEKPITPEDINQVKVADYNFFREGLVTEALAYRSFNYEPSEDENIESNLVFVGLTGFENQLVEGGKEKIHSLFDEGILPIIFCDDNKINGEIWARKVGLIGSSEEITTGLELDLLDKDELYKTISKTRVFCCVTAAQREIIISAFIKDGFKVAVVGEKISDSILINNSYLGIASDKAPNILKNISKVFLSSNRIDGVLEVRERGKKQKEDLISMTNNFLIFAIMFLTNIFSVYTFKGKLIYDEKDIALVGLSIFLFTLSVILLDRKINEKDSVLKISIVSIGIVCSFSYFAKDLSTIYHFAFVIFNIFIEILSTVKFTKSKLKEIVVILFPLIIFNGMTLIIMGVSEVITIKNIGMAAFILLTIINRFLIFLVRKWQR